MTSDALAARCAVVLGAARLILLKSASMPGGMSWAEAGARGLVDPYFARVHRAGSQMEVRVVNLRAWSGL